MMKTTMKINEISTRLKTISDPEDPFLQECREDTRKGVADLLNKWNKSYEKARQVRNTFLQMSEFERELRKQGFSILAGIDEVGRGPLAGPVVTSAVILPEDFYLPGLNDSKKISESKREQFYETIYKEAISIGVGIVHSEKIDEINIYQATKKAMMAAVNNLSELPDHLLIDAMELDIPIPQLSLIKGDARSITISAASIVAKVTRDRMMMEYGVKYPEYGFEKHMGYGTSQHLEALEKHGLTPWHRRSFAPVKEIAARK
ncbi:ribonuclease HII [Peribacillus sp. NPDC097295]|uniref:ribonuclease HII n=1 Tax=Peribacillus sp. NPDC097295 TaxID=3364402 RepID=UPI0038078DAA